jgi:glycerol-3-phosphate dehydrogenase
MWNSTRRETTWSSIDQAWDVLIVGGGITGAGLLRLAAKAGLRALLVEANDFSSGTSSRSSKLVHGGFRYLANKQFDVTKESVREREWMQREANYLVTPLRFVLPAYDNYTTKPSTFGLGVLIYDLLAPKWRHRSLNSAQAVRLCPPLRTQGWTGGYEYYDAQVDDSRLVLRLLKEACKDGATALNYARAETLLRTKDGKVCGAVLRDTAVPNGKTYEVRAGVVINAAGPWSDDLRAQVGAPGRIRKLRGSHLIFPRSKFPIQCGATIMHPRDRRALFILPWEGTSMIGTTDLDQTPADDAATPEPRISQGEVDYLLEALHFICPDLDLGEGDVISTFAGLRPTIKAAEGEPPSKVSRAHALWEEDGLITITGGKLTTFRIMARQALGMAMQRLGKDPASLKSMRLFEQLPYDFPLHLGTSPETGQYLAGRYGLDSQALLSAAQPGEKDLIAPLPNIWAELRWAARGEAVIHLDDLLLRRVRLGLLLPNGGLDGIDRIRTIVQPELGWDDKRWQQEVRRYQEIWKSCYSV